MSGTREALVRIGGGAYPIASDDDYLQAIGPVFEPEMVRLFEGLASGSRCILDVGANIGCTAILFGQLAEVVYAFEPSPTTFGFLQGNLERSGMHHVHPRNFGLGAEAGEFPLTFSPSNRSGGFVSNQTQASAGHVVEQIIVRPLDAVVESFGGVPIDFIKIDVEGFEGQVLKGATATLGRYRPTVVLELNHWCLNAFQRTSVPDFLDFLRSTFPILYAVDGGNHLDLHRANDSYVVMYHHILNKRFPNLVGAFDANRLGSFLLRSEYGFKA